MTTLAEYRLELVEAEQRVRNLKSIIKDLNGFELKRLRTGDKFYGTINRWPGVMSWSHNDSFRSYWIIDRDGNALCISNYAPFRVPSSKFEYFSCVEVDER